MEDYAHALGSFRVIRKIQKLITGSRRPELVYPALHAIIISTPHVELVLLSNTVMSQQKGTLQGTSQDLQPPAEDNKRAAPPIPV